MLLLEGEENMKKNILIILLIFLVPVITYFMLTMSNTSTAKTVETGKPQIIKFTSQMCLDCQTMNKIIKEIYPNYSEDIVLTEIQVQDGKPQTQEQIDKYNVTLVPTIILIDSQGKQVRRIEGAVSKDEMDKCLRALK